MKKVEKLVLKPVLKKESFFSKAYREIKIGLTLPTLPDHILKFEKKIYVKIFKVIGAICMYLILSRLHKEFDSKYFYIITLFLIGF